MENILENTTDSIWAINTDYQILYLNNAFRTDFKNAFGVELIQGDNILDQLPEAIYSLWKTRYDTALQGESFSFDESFSDKNNNTVYVHVSFSAILTNKKVTGVTCFGRDVTQEKLNEIELKRYSLLLKSCLESQKDTILLSVDKNFDYMYFNSAHFEVMKYAYGVEVEVGMNILECITDIEDRKAALRNYERALNGESHSNIRAYGEKNKEYFESYFNPIRNDENEIIGVTAMARNITDRVAQDEVLKESENSLNEANVTKNKFFSLITHDLRSPLSSITSLAKVLYQNFDELDTLKQKLYLKSICASLDRTYTLLEDLLLWARTQNNSIVFDLTKINLSKLADEVIEIFGQNIENKDLIINKSYPEDFEIYADRYMISTVIRNLLSNAIKFSYNQGVIDIRFETLTDASNKKVLISIKDNGVGISKENISKVFSIGESVSTTGTNKEKGTGLGLIMCKEFVDKHNGTITIESEINKGTTIKVMLPQK